MAASTAALHMAWADDCYHVLLQSGRKDPGTHLFYERYGFEGDVRIGYVARCPAEGPVDLTPETWNS